MSDLMVSKFEVGQANMMQPAIIDYFRRPSHVILIQILVTNLHHLSGWIVLEDLGQTIGENSHEVLLSHFVEVRVGDDAHKLVLDIVVQGEVDLADGREREQDLWVDRPLRRVRVEHLVDHLVDVLVLLRMAYSCLL